MPEHHTWMMVAGGEERALAFGSAARRCGVQGLSHLRRPDGAIWVRVTGPLSTDADSRSYSCAKDWVTTHPRGLRLVAEEEAGDLWN